ncbi:hypothetical protein ACEUZ9_004095 [Paracoccus litorisediminis]|uniref:hypothetical protein n=1 Tax=Paracoccus litorisediminis TaxID=2006130 RepID=UPI00372DEE60
MLVARYDPQAFERAIPHFDRRPWLHDELDPFSHDIVGRGAFSVDLLIVIGLALGEWPGWLIFGEGQPPRSSGLIRLLYQKISLLDPSETGPIEEWLHCEISKTCRILPREISSWFSCLEAPRLEAREALSHLLGVSASEIQRALTWEQPPPMEFRDMLRQPVPDPGIITRRSPSPYLPDTSRLFRREQVIRPLNTSRVIRILSDSAGVHVDRCILLRWLDQELTPSELELQLLNEAPPTDPSLATRYRREIATGRRLFEAAITLMKRRNRYSLTFRERVALALDICGLVSLSGSKERRLAALHAIGIDPDAAWLTSESLAFREEIELMSRVTGCHVPWFTHAIASPHSILG